MTFAGFEVDAASGELRRNGERVKLQDLPFRVLVLLLANAGSVVTREQLRTELWGASTFVDAEAGLNTAVAKLREAIGDSAESPRFIETLPKRGYRFIAASIAQPSDAVAPSPGPAPSSTSAAVNSASSTTPPRRFVLIMALVIAAAALTLWWVRAAQPITIAVVLFHNETGDASNDQLAQQLTDATVVALTANPRYAVIGNAAILRTPRIFADIQQIGRALDATYLVLGQVQRVGSSTVARAHFIRVADQKHLWAQAIEGDRAQLDRTVSQTITAAVDAALGRSSK